MKKFLLSLAAMLVLAGVVYAAKWGTGSGSKATASTTFARLAFTENVNTVSIYNSGTNDVFCLVNTTTNVLDTRITAGTAIPIPASNSFTFNAQGNTSIESLCYATTNASSAIYVAGY